ncbi:hypothetical protein DFJ74DRAFT_24377 [Hyaloraphidium curvatum]|nr:hypothetical protein DFJ74DRAFT_24377 [Hyaloraphidium curvatum]
MLSGLSIPAYIPKTANIEEFCELAGRMHALVPQARGEAGGREKGPGQDNDATGADPASGTLPPSTGSQGAPVAEYGTSGPGGKDVAAGGTVADIPAGAVVACTCGIRLPIERRGAALVPLFFFYSEAAQHSIDIPKAMCCFRKPEPCVIHHGAPLPAHAFPPTLHDDTDLRALPTISDLPRDIFHMHIFPLLFDCELITVAQASRAFRQLAEPEIRRRCERLSLIIPTGPSESEAGHAAFKRSLTKHHRRMERLRAVQENQSGPYWNLAVDTARGFPRILPSLDSSVMCSVM